MTSPSDRSDTGPIPGDAGETREEGTPTNGHGSEGTRSEDGEPAHIPMDAPGSLVVGEAARARVAPRAPGESAGIPRADEPVGTPRATEARNRSTRAHPTDVEADGGVPAASCTPEAGGRDGACAEEPARTPGATSAHGCPAESDAQESAPPASPAPCQDVEEATVAHAGAPDAGDADDRAADPVAYDETAPVLAWLRALRGRRRARTSAYVAYVVVLLLGGWYGMYAAGLALQLQHNALAQHAPLIRDLLPSGLTAIGLVAFLLALADGVWRGPVALPRPDTDWLLALPIRRRPVLLRWLGLAAAGWALAGALTGLAVALLVASAGLGSPHVLTAAGSATGACAGLLAAAVSVAVQRSPRAPEQLHRLGPLLVLPCALVCLQFTAAYAGRRLPLLEQVESWSGPWGWAGQPLLAAAGAGAPGWPAAAVLLAALTALGVAYAVRAVGNIPAARLRSAARTGAGLAAAFLAADARALRSTLPAPPRASSRVRARAARLRPRRRALLVLWRDVVALVAAPRRVAMAVILTVLAAAVLLSGAPAASFAAALLGYAAAGSLLEPARLDAEDVRRYAWSKRPFARTALHHGAVPAAALLVLGLLCALPATLNGDAGTLLAVAGAVPALTAAALAGAYRGPVPVRLLFAGAALADWGPFLAAIWQALPPLACATGLVLAGHAGPSGLPAVVRLAFAALLACAFAYWARRRATALARP
ncbi:DUF6297 family protein [Streptomyces sulphureus]|uniref:DUF6297 family protein n=1 Tax=Streptomyces sulphureus TaxID=47758 RepID=UPI00037CE8C3|nr:DUF6297 family protein [Streptomyces sulphureus]